MKNKRRYTFIFSSLSLIASFAFAFSGDNDPRFIIKNDQRNFHKLPLVAFLDNDHTPWASSFWPSIYGGIAFRWNGYYVDAPEVREYQQEVGRLKNEIKDLKQELFQDNPSALRIHDITLAIQNKNFKISELLKLKSVEHRKYFYDIKRPTSLDEVKAMTQQQRDKLSAAEKFDIYVALKTKTPLSLTLTNNVLAAAGPDKAYWEGICHGWSSASIEFNEPQVKTYTQNGITLNFGSSDFKALLSYYHAAITKNPILSRKVVTGRVGKRCSTVFSKEAWFIKDGKEFYKSVDKKNKNQIQIKPVPAECVDTDPGAFHIIISNLIAFQKQAFVAEVVRDKEVWNQPVFGYETQILEHVLKPDAFATHQTNKQTNKQVRVKTRMHYGNDGGRMFWKQDDSEEEFYAWWNPTNGTPNFRSAHKDFEYLLDLDKRGNIIGGRWLSYERPDFLWLKKTKGFVTNGIFLGIVKYMNHLQDFVSIKK